MKFMKKKPLKKKKKTTSRKSTRDLSKRSTIKTTRTVKRVSASTTKPLKLNLPKGYLSWSQYNLWVRSPEQYRREYYYGIKRESSVEMRFGDAVAKLMQSGATGPVIDRIPRFEISEFAIEKDTLINGVPVVAYIDTFDPKKVAFDEYKTGHADRKGNAPWDRVKVAKHGQLTFYAAALKAKFGKVHPLCNLHWIETEAKPMTEDFGGIEMTGTDVRALRLTGRIESFPRKIEKWEVTLMENQIRKVALEISKDYTLFVNGMLTV